MEEKDATQRTGVTSLSRSRRLSGSQEAKPITKLADFESFMTGEPQIRRWYLARVYGPEGGQDYVDLYFSPVTESGQSALIGLDASDLIQLPADNPAWWQEEDFDRPVHIPLEALRDFLERRSDYPAEDALEEGMVFIEIWTNNLLRWVPFSFQAREASKQIYRQLLDPSASA